MKVLNEGTIRAEKKPGSRPRRVSIKKSKEQASAKEPVGFPAIPENVRIRTNSIKSNLSSVKVLEEIENDKTRKGPGPSPYEET